MSDINTCAYCGSKVNINYCSFCEMELTERYILQDGKRLSNGIEFFPEQQGIFQNTPELLQLETIELLCLLRHAREYRSEVYQLRILAHKATAAGGDVGEIQVASYSDYEEATRKVWVIENIIKERVGYYPEKVTNNFLNIYMERIEKSEQKKMYIKKNQPKIKKGI